MGKLIQNGAVVENTVTHIDDEATLPTDGAITVSQARWQENKAELIARGNVGVRVGAGETHHDLVEDLDSVSLIAIEFDAFKDGRGYSYARLLRERNGFKGEIRAIGDVLQDQLLPMKRCGFDAFEVRADRDINEALNGFTQLSETYQTDAHEDLPLYRRASR